MEFKLSTAVVFLLFLLLSTPLFSEGGSDELDSAIYDIDYRGPETHSSVPPPRRSHGRPFVHNQKGTWAATGSNASEQGNPEKQEKKIQG